VAESKKKASKAASPKKAAKKKTSRAKGAEPGSRGLEPAGLLGEPPPDVGALALAIGNDGGQVIGVYRDPLGGKFTVLAGLPIDKVEPTPFQRDLSATHVKRLTDVIDKLDVFLDPIITVRTDDGVYWTPNGNHRLHAMRNLGAKSVVALVVPGTEIAYKILALNTEKAHNLKEKALEVVRMARSLVDLGDRPETTFALEFEEPSLVTLGICYEQRARFSGSAYSPILKRVEDFMACPLSEAIERRTARARTLLELDDAVAEAVKALKARGFDSPYLKAFVVARVNPLRFAKAGPAEFDEVFGKMLSGARAFDAGTVKPDQVAAASGPPAD
jgi:ParB family transcriptional regulator, chromosome partitioning protein